MISSRTIIIAAFAVMTALNAARADESEPKVWITGEPLTFSSEPGDGHWPEPWAIEGDHQENRPPKLVTDPADADNQVGQIDQSSNVRFYQPNLSMVDVSQVTRIRWWQNANTVRNAAGLVARYKPAEGDAAEGRLAYRAELNVKPRELRLVSEIGDTVHTLASIELDWVIQQWYHLRFDVEQISDSETRLRIKLWKDGEAEPGEWTLTHVDDTPELQNLQGHAGLFGRTTGNRMWAYDDYLAVAGEDAVEGVMLDVVNGQVTIEDAQGRTISLPFSELDVRNRHDVVRRVGWHPAEMSPDWVEGYAVRYKLRIASDSDESAETVTAALPNGGWLKDDASDLIVKTSDGTEIPVLVLSHADLADTIIQFRRHEQETVYWVYAANPDAPDPDPALEQRLETARKARETTQLAMMAAQKKAGERAGELRDLQAEIKQQRETRDNATEELAEWEKLLPERVADQKEAAEALKQAEETHKEAAAAHEKPGGIAETKTAAARKLTRAAQAARRAASQAEQAHEQAKHQLAEAREEPELAREAHAEAEQHFESAAAAAREAETEAEQAKQAANGEDLSQEQREQAEQRAKQLAAAATEARAKADEAKQALDEAAARVDAAPEKIEQAEQAVQDRAAALAAAEKKAEQAEAEAKPAEEAAREARLAAAPTASALEEAENALNTARSRAERTRKLVAEARERIERATKIKTEAEAALAKLEPTLEPTQKAADQAQAAAREAAAEAEQKEQTYYDLAYETDPRLFKEGMTVEYRQWEGDKLGDWPVVVEGLQRSDTVTDNAIVSSTYQKTKHFRSATSRDFAASYRGYLNVDEAGVYSFFVNADDTAFLFINGYLVYSRTGTNKPLQGRVPIYSIGADMQLEAGVHTIELHHVVGNTLGATGYEMLLWIPPGEENWQFVPQAAFTRSALAVPVAVEAKDGEPVSIFRYSVDDKLTTDGVSLYLTRFEALGGVTPDRLEWQFEDGTNVGGRSIRHVFFEEGDATVTLKSHPDAPPFRRRVHIKAHPNPTAPHALSRTVEAIDQMALGKLATPKLNSLYHFLRMCGQEDRWPVTEAVARELLSREHVDIKQRALLYSSLIHALAHQSRSSDAVKMIDEALAAVGDVRTLRARVMLEAANMYRDVMRDFTEADELYGRIIEENRRLRHPVVREAAVAWGDMYLDADNRAQAGEAYRMAERLGRIGAGPEKGDPVAQGALLRMAEQQLEQDDVRQSRRMLRRIEENYPEQKLDGLYRFLRAEADRHAGEYERATRHYEVVMRLQEWASYHPHALHGIADSYARMGEFQESLDWYKAVQDSYPDFYHNEALEQEVEVIRDRLERASTGGADDGGDPARAGNANNADSAVNGEIDGAGDDVANGDAGAIGLFARLTNNFETSAQEQTGDHIEPPVTMGFDGPGTFLVRPADGETNLPALEMKNLPSQGSLWVEFWYRTRLGDTLKGAHIRYANVRVFNGDEEELVGERFYMPRTFGEWRKVAFTFDAPRTPDGRVAIQVRCGAELMEIDGVEVRHISDGQNSALRRFSAGANPQ